jgi:hypothetical protein
MAERVAPAGFGEAVGRALERPAGGPLASAIPTAAQTVIVLDPDDPRAPAALPVVIEALVRTGHARGRLLVLAAATGPPPASAAAQALREAAGSVPVVFHDPDRSAAFRVGRAAAIDVDVDDELREAEAVVVLGAIASSASGARRPAEWLIVPGLAVRATRDALRAATAPERGARALDAHAAWSTAAALVHVDFEIAWRREPGGDVVAAGVPPFDWVAATTPPRARRDP